MNLPRHHVARHVLYTVPEERWLIDGRVIGCGHRDLDRLSVRQMRTQEAPHGRQA